MAFPINLIEHKNTSFRKIRTALKHNKSPKPKFITDDDRVQFITRIYIHKDFKNIQVSDQVSDQVKILKFCKTEKSIQEIMQLMGLKHRTYFRKNILKLLLDNKLLELTNPDSPNSPKQKYITTKKGLELLK